MELHPRYHLLGTNIIYPFSQSYFFEDDSFPNFPNLVGISFKQPTTPGRLEKVDGLRSSQLLHRSFSPSRAGPFCNGSWRKVGFGSLFFFENLLLRHFGTVLQFSVVWDSLFLENCQLFSLKSNHFT